MGQSTHAILIICTCKNVIRIFLTEPKKCPLYFCMPYFTKIEVGKMDRVWVGSVDMYFVNVGSKVTTTKNNTNIN